MKKKAEKKMSISKIKIASLSEHSQQAIRGGSTVPACMGTTIPRQSSPAMAICPTKVLPGTLLSDVLEGNNLLFCETYFLNNQTRFMKKKNEKQLSLGKIKIASLSKHQQASVQGGRPL